MWLFGLIAIAGLVGAGYLILSHGVRSVITQELINREKIIARADAGNIVSFFETIGSSVALRAQMRSMERVDSTTSEDLDAFVDQWRESGLVAGIVLTDNRGVVILNSSIGGTADVGESLADRDYFVWAKNQKGEGEYFIGAPVISRLGASEGQTIVTVASPVFTGNVFRGVVSVAVELLPLTQRNLELLRISDRTEVYLVDQSGNTLYSSSGSRTLSTNLINIITTSQEGQLQKEGRLIAYSPVALGSQKWVLVVASPLEEVVSRSMPLHIRQVVILILVSVTTLLFGIIFSRSR